MARLAAAAVALLLLAPAVAGAARRPRVYGTVWKANKAAAKQVYETFFQLDPKLRQQGEPMPRFHPGCRRLTSRMFRCDWTGENPAYYTVAGTVRVTFRPFGTDAVLERGSTCAPVGSLYEVTGVSECPS